MANKLAVAVIAAAGNTGRSVINGLLTSRIDFDITGFTRAASTNRRIIHQLKNKGVRIVMYDLDDSETSLVTHLKGIDILISCMTWEHLEQQIPWIEAAKEAGVKRFVPSEWAGPTPRGVIDIKDKKLDILNVVQRMGLPYTIIDVGCYFQVFVPKIPSGRSNYANSIYIDHRIVGDGNQEFALTDIKDIGEYVAKIIVDPRTLNKHVFAYTEVLSMNGIWNVMSLASGETPPKEYVSEAELHEIIATCRKRLEGSSESAHHPNNIMDTANFNMGQYRISWCVRGENTPEYAEYLGYLDFWKLFPDHPKGRSLEEFYQHILNRDAPGRMG